MTLSLVGSVNGTPAGVFPFDAVIDRTGQRMLSSRMVRTEFVNDQIIASEGEVLNDLLVIASGVVKSVRAMPDGRRQIVAFRVEGDIVGLHRAGTPSPTSVQAVTVGVLHRIPWGAVHALAERYPSIEKMLLDLAGDEIATLHAHLLSLGRKTTEEKLASFLLDACRPSADQSRAGREHRLPMRRSDIADYLGLTTESVSREFSRLKRLNVISMPKPSRVILLNRPALEGIAAGVEFAQTAPTMQAGAV